MTQQSYYSASILQFTQTDTEQILTHFSPQQKSDWKAKIELLKVQFNQLPHLAGDVVFGFAQPEINLTTEVIVLYRGLVFVLEIGFDAAQYDDQVTAALHQQAQQLKTAHIGSQSKFIIPVAIETSAAPQPSAIMVSEDLVANTMCDSGEHLAALIEHFSNQYKDDQIILSDWLESGFNSQ